MAVTVPTPEPSPEPSQATPQSPEPSLPGSANSRRSAREGGSDGDGCDAVTVHPGSSDTSPLLNSEKRRERGEGTEEESRPPGRTVTCVTACPAASTDRLATPTNPRADGLPRPTSATTRVPLTPPPTARLIPGRSTPPATPSPPPRGAASASPEAPRTRTPSTDKDPQSHEHRDHHLPSPCQPRPRLPRGRSL